MNPKSWNYKRQAYALTSGADRSPGSREIAVIAVIEKAEPYRGLMRMDADYSQAVRRVNKSKRSKRGTHA